MAKQVVSFNVVYDYMFGARLHQILQASIRAFSQGCFRKATLHLPGRVSVYASVYAYTNVDAQVCALMKMKVYVNV